MFQDCKLPPIYRLTELPADADVTAAARRLAAAGGDPATVLCAARDDRFDCAIVLHPHLSAAEARLGLYVAMLGLGDALGAVVPAGIDITYRWPNRLEANIGAVAEVGVVLPEPSPPDGLVVWMVIATTVVIGPLAGEGLHHGFPETSLRDEGAAEVTSAELLEAFTRHFLVWVNRWQDDGFGPIRKMWLHHARDVGETITLERAGRKLTGVFEGVDEDGALLLRRGRGTQRVALEASVSASSC